MAQRHFTRGSSTFVCECCGRRTRMTTQPMGDCRYCGECDELLMLQNSLWDNGREDWMVPARDEFAAKIKKLGGDLAKVAAYIPDLFKLAA